MTSIHTLGKKYGFKIIEDASHAIGGRYKEEPVGNCRFSDITVCSFHPVKIITTGEGGMALTNDDKLAEKLRLLRSHGITSDLGSMRPRPENELWNYQQIDLGFNYRMTDINAALGLSQMSRLDEFVKTRHRMAKRYDSVLSDLCISTPWQHPDTYSSYHLYVVRINLDDIKKTNRQIYKQMNEAGVNVNLHYIPVYRHPYFEPMGFVPGYCPNAEKYYTEVISLPLYSAFTEAQQDVVVRTLELILN